MLKSNYDEKLDTVRLNVCMLIWNSWICI